MKTEEIKKLRNKELREVETLLDKKRLDLAKFQVKILSGKEKNLKVVKAMKKEIAQIMTLIRERKARKI